MGVYRKLAILTRGTLRYARGTLASTLVYATQYARVRYKYTTSTLPDFNFFLTGTRIKSYTHVHVTIIIYVLTCTCTCIYNFHCMLIKSANSVHVSALPLTDGIDAPATNAFLFVVLCFTLFLPFSANKRSNSLMMPNSSSSRSLHSLPPHFSPSSSPHSPPSPHTLSISSSYTRRYSRSKTLNLMFYTRLERLMERER